jgi:antitoxin HicB
MEWHFEYPANLEQDSAGFYLVTSPDFSEAATDARSQEAALSEAIDCLEETVAGRMKRGDDIPTPSHPLEGMELIALPALYAMKAALYVAFRQAQLSQSALAAKLGKDEKEVRRLLDPGHASRTSALETALHSIGKRVRMVVSDAS